MKNHNSPINCHQSLVTNMGSFGKAEGMTDGLIEQPVNIFTIANTLLLYIDNSVYNRR